MKTFHLRAIPGAALLLVLAAAAQAQAPAQNVPNLGCSDLTIKGDWGFKVSGGILNTNGAIAQLRDGVAMTHFDGHGMLVQEDYVMAGGEPMGPPTTFHTNESGTYHVNADCTGNATINFPPFPGGAVISIMFVVSNFGQTIHAIVSELIPPVSMDPTQTPKLVSIHSDAERLSYF
jgi:hypothetical protein